MSKYKLINLNNNKVILDSVTIADTFGKRLVGLLGKKELQEGHGLIIRPCNSIHTLMMRFEIDVAFVDNDDIVIHLVQNMKSNRISRIILKSKYVVEGKGGSFQNSLSVGDRLEIVT